jgi:hypothetical protein
MSFCGPQIAVEALWGFFVLCLVFIERRLDIDFVNEHFCSFLFVGLFLFYRLFAHVSVDVFMMFFFQGGFQWIDSEPVVRPTNL